jgi:hypothetical protein
MKHNGGRIRLNYNCQAAVDEKESRKKENGAKLQTEEGKEIYRQRKKIVEPVFGQVKFNLGFRRFRLRRLDKASGECDIGLLSAQHQENLRQNYGERGWVDDLTGEIEAVYNPA